MADPAVEDRSHEARRFVRLLGRARPIRAAAHEAEHVYELEREGESDWTPWLVLAFLVVFYAAVGLVMFGIVEGVSHLVASAPSTR